MIVRTSKLRHTKGTEIGAKVEVRLTSRGNFIDDPNSFVTPILSNGNQLISAGNTPLGLHNSFVLGAGTYSA